jgi:hypothetical protein
MKKIITLTFVLLFAFIYIAASQDIIYFKNGSKEDAKIVQVGTKEIQYKKFSNLEGPVYSLAKSEIMLITYENGDFEMFTTPDDVSKQTKEELKTNFTKNLIGYHLFDVVYGDFTFSYERILASGTIGIKVPFGIGYAYNSDYFNNTEDRVKNAFYCGVGINFYPTGQGKWRYFVGPNIRVGYGKQSYWEYYYDEYGNYIEGEISTEGIYTKFFVDNGVMFTPVRNFSVSTIVGVGIRFFPEADQYYNAVMPSGYFSINIHYRF